MVTLRSLLLSTQMEMVEVKIILGKLENVVVEVESQQEVVSLVQHAEVLSLHSLGCLSVSADRAPGKELLQHPLRLHKWKQ